MEYAAYFLLLILIPFCAFKFTKRVTTGIAIACALGFPILVSRMIYMEAHALDSDFDITFPVGVAFWCFILGLVYCCWATAFALVRRRAKYLLNDEVLPKKDRE